MDLKTKKILITGASGRLGQQITYELIRLGVKPIAHVRESSDTKYIDSLKLEKRTADLRQREKLPYLVSGVDYVIHTVGLIDFRQDRLTQFAGVNAVAAAELFEAARAARVKKFVHISTVAAVGGMPRSSNSEEHRGDTNLVNEELPFNLGNLRIPYIMSKRAAEIELLKLSEKSETELVIVNPSIVIAPSRTGDDRAKAKKRLKGFVVPDLLNRLNLVDIRDVAVGVIAALRLGRHRERYILGGDNMTARDLILAISIELGKTPHLFKFPRAFFTAIANLSLFYAKVSGQSKISFYPDLVKLMDYDWAYSSNKSRTELGYKNRSVYASLKELLNNDFTDTFMKPVR